MDSADFEHLVTLLLKRQRQSAFSYINGLGNALLTRVRIKAVVSPVYWRGLNVTSSTWPAPLERGKL